MILKRKNMNSLTDLFVEKYEYKGNHYTQNGVRYTERGVELGGHYTGYALKPPFNILFPILMVVCLILMMLNYKKNVR